MKQEELLCEDNCLHTELIETSKKNVPDDDSKLLGIVASRDYRVNHTPDDASVTTFMTPIEKLVTAPENTSLHDCNNIIWDNKINTLPLVDAEGNHTAVCQEKPVICCLQSSILTRKSTQALPVGRTVQTPATRF